MLWCWASTSEGGSEGKYTPCNRMQFGTQMVCSSVASIEGCFVTVVAYSAHLKTDARALLQSSSRCRARISIQMHLQSPRSGSNNCITCTHQSCSLTLTKLAHTGQTPSYSTSFETCRQLQSRENNHNASNKPHTGHGWAEQTVHRARLVADAV